MPSFEVLVNPASLSSQPGREQAIVVTANSRLEGPVTARVSIRTEPATAAAWIIPPVNPLGRFPGPNSTCNFAFALKVPPEAAPGTYRLLFDVIDVELPDDHFGSSAPLALTIGPKPITEGRPPPRRWWILAAAAVLVLGVGFVLWRVFFRTKGMPDLRKRTYAEAIAMLDTARFVIRRRDTLNQDTTSFPRGVIVSQSIPPKAKLEADSNRLFLVVQQSYTVVPAVSGLPAIEAAKRLGEESLRVSLHQRPTSGRAEDRVEQSLSAGMLVPRGVQVGVKVPTHVDCPGSCTPERIQITLLRRQIAVEQANHEALQNWKPPAP
jgi:hypothetical protein